MKLNYIKQYDSTFLICKLLQEFELYKTSYF